MHAHNHAKFGRSIRKNKPVDRTTVCARAVVWMVVVTQSTKSHPYSKNPAHCDLLQYVSNRTTNPPPYTTKYRGFHKNVMECGGGEELPNCKGTRNRLSNPSRINLYKLGMQAVCQLATALKQQPSLAQPTACIFAAKKIAATERINRPRKTATPISTADCVHSCSQKRLQKNHRTTERTTTDPPYNKTLVKNNARRLKKEL